MKWACPCWRAGKLLNTAWGAGVFTNTAPQKLDFVLWEPDDMPEIEHESLFSCLKLIGNCCLFDTRSVYTIQPCTMSHQFIQNHMRRVHVCYAVIRTYIFGRMTGIFSFIWYCSNKGGGNGYWNKSQHRKLTMEKKIGCCVLSVSVFIWLCVVHSNSHVIVCCQF